MEGFIIKMSKKIFLMMVLLVFVSGCVGILPGKGIGVNYEAVYSGTEGVVVSFLKNAPQEKLYADLPFKIGLDVANLGAEDTDAYLNIGFEKEYMSLEESMPFPIINLEGKDAYNLEGSHTYEFFNAKTTQPVAMGESHKALISVTYCYDYSTIAMMDVCIDTDVYGKRLKKVCTVSDKSLSSQGAPLAVKKVEVEMLPISQDNIKSHFMIHIQNVGNGDVMEKGDSLNVCKGHVQGVEWDLVSVKATLSKEALSCKREGVVRLDDGKAEISCTSSSISYDKGTYTAPLVIKLSYGYYSIITKEVEILREEI